MSALYTQEYAEKIIGWVKGNLKEGVTNRKHPYHLVCFADVKPSVKTMVVRRVEFDKRIIFLHTDNRSQKVRDISFNPETMLLFYDSENKVQLRIKAISKVHSNDVTAYSAWQGMQNISKECYCSAHAPGQQIDLDSEVELNEKNSLTSLESGYENFSVVACHFYEIDYLELHYQRHIRVKFNWAKKTMSYKWLTP